MRVFVASFLVVSSSLLAGACSSRSTTPTTPSADVLHACAIASACLEAPVSDDCELLAYVAAFPNPIQTLAYQCYFSATDCASYEACQKATPAQVAACGGSKSSQCQGDVFVDCGTGTALDCSSVGYVCGQNAQGAGCGPMTCDPTTFASKCQGGTAVSCDPSGGVVSQDPCDDPLGPQVCVETASGATCADPTGTCDPSFKASCQGTVATNCKQGLVSTMDCGAIGFGVGCQVGADGTATCVGASGCDDDGGPGMETCDAGVITFCLFGTTTTLDCRSYGLSGCTATTSTGGTFARCTP